MTDETIVWSKGDDPNDLTRLCDRAIEAGVEVTAVHVFRFANACRVTVTAIPHRYADEYGVGVHVVTVTSCDRRDGLTVVPTLESVTATLPPERPSWLPKDAEDGDWLIQDPGTVLHQWRDGRVWLTDGSELKGGDWATRFDWIIWPVWAELKAERAETERLRAEVERLSDVTEDMVDAATYAWDSSPEHFRPGLIRDALRAALAVRDGKE